MLGVLGYDGSFGVLPSFRAYEQATAVTATASPCPTATPKVRVKAGRPATRTFFATPLLPLQLGAGKLLPT